MDNDIKIEKLTAAVECSMALNLPYNEGLALLEKHGFDNSGRFDFPATKFVERKQKEALGIN